VEYFACSLKRKFKDKDLDKATAVLRKLIGRKVKAVNGRQLSPVAKLPSKIHDLLQIGLRRTIELAEAAVREMNRQSIAPTFVLVRGAFETTCLLWDAVRRVSEVVEKDDTAQLDDLDKFLMDVLMGFKSKDWAFSEEYQARNVLTIIDRLSKQLDAKFMWYYEGLSEHAHPNYLGMMRAYQQSADEETGIVRFADGPNERRDASMKLAIGGLATSVAMMELAMSQYEEMQTGFATLCERAIHEGGTWPEGVEYPIKR
jgi:hypothetical protein